MIDVLPRYDIERLDAAVREFGVSRPIPVATDASCEQTCGICGAAGHYLIDRAAPDGRDRRPIVCNTCEAIASLAVAGLDAGLRYRGGEIETLIEAFNTSMHIRRTVVCGAEPDAIIDLVDRDDARDFLRATVAVVLGARENEASIAEQAAFATAMGIRAGVEHYRESAPSLLSVFRLVGILPERPLPGAN